MLFESLINMKSLKFELADRALCQHFGLGRLSIFCVTKVINPLLRQAVTPLGRQYVNIVYIACINSTWSVSGK